MPLFGALSSAAILAGSAAPEFDVVNSENFSIGFGAWSTPGSEIGKAVDGIFTSDEERLDKQAVLEGIRNSPYMAAMQIAMVEAGSSDKWTSRARPMLIYAFCMVFVTDRAVMPLAWWLLQVFHDIAIPPPPSLLNSDMIMTVVAGVLGTSWIAGRSAEKMAGRTK